jgi:hypothetical protein
MKILPWKPSCSIRSFMKILPWEPSFSMRSFMKLLSWEPRCPMRKDGRRDGHDEANSRFSKFFDRASKPSLCQSTCSSPHKSYSVFLIPFKNLIWTFDRSYFVPILNKLNTSKNFTSDCVIHAFLPYYPIAFWIFFFVSSFQFSFSLPTPPCTF